MPIDVLAGVLPGTGCLALALHLLGRAPAGPAWRPAGAAAGT